MAELIRKIILPPQSSTAISNGQTLLLESSQSERDWRSTIGPLAFVLACACAVNWPCLFWGLQYGHDHNLHITYLHFFAAQLRTGELYPRWITGLNFGAGSPIFFVQYPLPYYVAAAFERVLPIPATAVGHAHALGLFVFLTGLVSGVTSWLWCRSLSNSVIAAVASGFYLTMPYIYSCDVYYRAAIGEYSALAWIPLVLFFANRIDSQPSRAVAGLAFAFAMVVLSNLFIALLFIPFLIFYAACVASRSMRLVTALRTTVGAALGAGLSSVYLLPMNANRPFFSIANMLKAGPDNFFYRDHLFPFDNNLFPVGDLSSRMADVLLAGLAILLVLLLVIRIRQSPRSNLPIYAALVCILATCVVPIMDLFGLSFHQEIANFRVIDVRSRIFLVLFLTLEVGLLAYGSLRRMKLIAKFLVSASLMLFFLTTRWSEWLWLHASFLWNIQFPWRLTGLLSVFTLGLVTLGLSDLWPGPAARKNWILLCTGVWVAVAGASCFVLHIPRNLTPPFTTEFKQRVETPFVAYASVSKMPTPEELGPRDGLTDGALIVQGKGTARVDTISARRLRLLVNCDEPCKTVVRLVYYPTWEAHEAASGERVALRSSTRAGLTELSLGAGSHDLDLELPRQASEAWGVAVSVISLLVAAVLLWRDS